jgi:hypothetical protein
MSATVFVRNLPFDVTQEALEKAFSDIGPIKKVDLIKDKGKSKAEATTRGFAFVRLYVRTWGLLNYSSIFVLTYRMRMLCCAARCRRTRSMRSTGSTTPSLTAGACVLVRPFVRSGRDRAFADLRWEWVE